MLTFKFFKGCGETINWDWGETEQFRFLRVGPVLFSPNTFAPYRQTYYEHRDTREVVEGPIVGEENHLFHAVL